MVYTRTKRTHFMYRLIYTAQILYRHVITEVKLRYLWFSTCYPITILHWTSPFASKTPIDLAAPAGKNKQTKQNHKNQLDDRTGKISKKVQMQI